MIGRRFSIVVATDEAGGIGKDGAIPWNFPGDMRWFRYITTRTKDPEKFNAVIMGRNTWESLPPKYRPLPRRINIVISSTMDMGGPDAEPVIVMGTLEEALRNIPYSVENVFVIGGAMLYGAALQNIRCEYVYWSFIPGVYDCDTFFPEMPEAWLGDVARFQDGRHVYRFAATAAPKSQAPWEWEGAGSTLLALNPTSATRL